MNERVVEILVYIMAEIRGQKSHANKLESISRDLLQRGYSQHEISFAFSWLFERYQDEAEEVARHTGPTLRGSFRVLHEAEKMIISREAYGYLLQLKQLNLLNDLEIEHIIERAMMAGADRITEADVKVMVASLWFIPEGANERVFSLPGESSVVQ